jgi:hypothetical protein
MVNFLFPHITELCEKVEYKDCQQFSNYTVFPNLLRGLNHSEAVQAMTAFQGIIATNCSDHALHFFCSAAFLQCDQGAPRDPCKSLCEGSCFYRQLKSSRKIFFRSEVLSDL